MGILDAKTRILDTILTPEGRAQLAKGALRATFYSFTDSGAVYKEDTLVSASVSGSTAGVPVLDPTYRFTLESTGLPHDQIVFEADDSGKLVGFPVSGSERLIVKSGQIFSGSFSGVRQRVQITGSQFNSMAAVLLSSSVNSFKNQMILRSPDPIDDKEREFLVGPKTHDFNIAREFPFKKDDVQQVNVNHAESFFQDRKISHIKNFKFMPPVNKARVGSTERTPVADYVNINQAPIEKFEVLEEELKRFESVTVNFTETSRENNLLCQFFETSEGVMKKLDVVDFGSFIAPGENSPKHVFFAGKVFIDDYNTPTFINMFTLIFEN
jgi:hypothetical protein